MLFGFPFTGIWNDLPNLPLQPSEQQASERNNTYPSGSGFSDGWTPNCEQNLSNPLVTDGLHQINEGGVRSLVCIVAPLADASRVLRVFSRFLKSRPEGTLKVRIRLTTNPETLRVPKRSFQIHSREDCVSKLLPFFRELNNIESIFVGSSDINESYGFVVQQLCEDPDYPSEQFALHLALWIRETDGSNFSSELEVLGDEIASLTDLFQGWICNWAWKPLFAMVDEVNDTPLEDALSCIRGRAPEYPMTQKHCKRYLRGFGARVWLGPDIAQFISLQEGSVETSQIGSARKLLFPDTATHDTVESVVAPLIEYPANGE